MPGKISKFFVSIIAVTAVLPLFASAQFNIDIPYALSNELNVEVIPTHPHPYETVFIKLSIYTADLDSATITWYKNGKKVLQGRGETTYSFQAGPAGEEIRMEVAITLISGEYFNKYFTLNPTSIDLVWEADSYVPPFYKGKALHPYQGTLKIVAMPEFVKNGRRVSPANLIYKWSNDVMAYQNQSGYGKNVLVLNGSLLGRSERIYITVTDPVSNMAASSFMEITPSDPEILFYENNPYYGPIFESAMPRVFDLNREEVQVMVSPFHFTNERDGALKYSWRLNNQTISGLAGSRTAIFRRPEGSAGRSAISLQVENGNHILQQASAGFTINFENE